MRMAVGAPFLLWPAVFFCTLILHGTRVSFRGNPQELLFRIAVDYNSHRFKAMSAKIKPLTKSGLTLLAVYFGAWISIAKRIGLLKAIRRNLSSGDGRVERVPSKRKLGRNFGGSGTRSSHTMTAVVESENMITFLVNQMKLITEQKGSRLNKSYIETMSIVMPLAT